MVAVVPRVGVEMSADGGKKHSDTCSTWEGAMVAARTTAKGLSTMDLEQIRDTLAGGRKPKVVFTESAGQMAGQFGQVVQLTDPELSDEWVVVRFGKDELPFSPTDLAIAPKAGSARRTTVPSPREETPVPAAPASSTVDTSRGSGPSPAAPQPALDLAPPPPVGRPAASNGKSVAATGAANGKPAAPAGDGDKRAAAPRKAAKPKPPPGLTVTLAYAEGEWTVAANQGSKALAKPYVIKPAEALKMVSLVDVPGVHDAVEEIVTAARTDAQRQAERLRAELAEIETRLAELREAE
jgi:hypothetical protein